MTIFKELSQFSPFSHKNKPLLILYGFDFLLIILILFLGFQLYFPSSSVNLSLKALNENITEIEQPKLGVSNPAAVYCKEMGYEYQNITENDGSQQGACIFPDKKSCSDWEFYRGKCGEEFSYCTQKGYDLVSVADGKDPYSYEYSMCVSRSDGKHLGSVNKIMDIVGKSTKGRTNTSTWEYQNKPVEEAPKNPTSGLTSSPSTFDWRNYNGSNWVTSVKNQGYCGSCWAYSAVGTVEGAYNVVTNNPNYDLDFSEQYLVSDCFANNSCNGGWSDYALTYIKDYGIPDESCMPYIDGGASGCPQGSGGVCDDECTYQVNWNCSDCTCSDRCSDWSSRLTKIDSMGTTAAWGVPANIETMKADLIEYGPLSIAFDVGTVDPPSFAYWDSDILRCVGSIYANHAVVLVGYNDTGDYNTSYWIVKNSWGDDWNGDGYFKLGFGECVMEESGVYYAEPSEKKFYIQDSAGTNRASLSSLGNIVLDGTCTASSTCTAPDNSFIIQNSAGSTVGYISSAGNMCIETGTCAGGSASCNSPSGEAFIIQNSGGGNSIYIDETGDLCLIGTLTQNGTP